MRTPATRCRRLLEAGEQAIVISLRHPDPYLTERVGRLGFDGVMIDLQHGPLDYHEMYVMLVALAASEGTPLVRLPGNDPALAMRVLDAGAFGVACPRLETREAVERFVEACRYPPRGYRSLGPNRAAFVPDYLTDANDAVLTLAVIDTPTAYANLDEIASTEGLDGLLLEGDAAMREHAYEIADGAGCHVMTSIELPLPGADVAVPRGGVVVRDDLLYRDALEQTIKRARSVIREFEVVA